MDRSMLKGMARDVVRCVRPPTPAALARLSRRIGVPVPPELRRLLCTINGGDVRGEWVNGEVMLSRFYGLRRDDLSLLEWIDKTWTPNDNYDAPGLAHLPTDTIPIAADIGDNWICLVVKGRQAGAVYYWDHEEGGGYGAGSTIRNAKEMRRLAPSLSAFLRGFKREGPPRNEALELALTNDDVAPLERLLAASTPEELAKSLASGRSLLEEACARGGVRTVRLLLDRGALADHPAWGAIHGRRPRTLRLLLEHGVKPRRMDVMACVQRGHVPMLRAMLDHIGVVSRADIAAARKRLEELDTRSDPRVKAMLDRALRP